MASASRGPWAICSLPPKNSLVCCKHSKRRSSWIFSDATASTRPSIRRILGSLTNEMGQGNSSRGCRMVLIPSRRTAGSKLWRYWIKSKGALNRDKEGRPGRDEMNTTNLQRESEWFDVAAALLLSLVIHTGIASPAYSAILAQPQAAPQQTNGRGAIGINCKPEDSGCRIQRITKSSPAERAGLRVGDLVLRLNPSDSASAVEQIAKNAPGTKITLPVQRGGEQMQVPVVIEDQLAMALRGAALGDPGAEEALGNIYRSGVGVPKNPAEALKWLRKAADQGLDAAQADLGWMYEHGEGVAKDEQVAFEWYRKAAEQGNAPAEYLLVVMYAQGRGVPKDAKTAAEWYRKAADQGQRDAQYAIGWLYEHGEGVARDDSAAFAWYRKAAEQGNALAEY